MKKTQNSYDILNVSPDATQADIHAAYRKLAMAWHPDRHEPSKRSEAGKRFARLQDAYNKIKTPAGRTAYNQWLATQTHQILQTHATVTNDNTKPFRSFIDTLETIFWPIDRKHRQSGQNKNRNG